MNVKLSMTFLLLALSLFIGPVAGSTDLIVSSDEMSSVTFVSPSSNDFGTQIEDSKFRGWEGLVNEYAESNMRNIDYTVITQSLSYVGINDIITPDGRRIDDGQEKPPSEVTNLEAVAVGAHQVDLTWDITNDKKVSGYNIYRDGVFIEKITDMFYSDTGLEPDTVYRYTVGAYDRANTEGLRSEDVFVKTESLADTTAPSQVNGLVIITLGPHELDLAWNAATDDTAVVGYFVYRDGTLIANVTDTSLLDSGLTEITSYSYTVSAYDAVGNEGEQSVAAIGITDPIPDTTAPSQVTGLTVTDVLKTGIGLSWDAASDDTGVAGYYIYRDDIRVATSATTDYFDAGIDIGVYYIYTVSAFDAAGNEGLPSESVTEVIPPTILIDGNEDLANYPGDGTLANPYRIDDLSISWHEYALIEVRNTDAYFIINNAILDGQGTAPVGILFSNVENGAIANSVITNTQIGVGFSSSTQSTVSGVSISGSTLMGVQLENSGSNTLDSITVSGNAAGVLLAESTSNLISQSTISSNNGNGISLVLSDFNTIEFNVIFNNLGDGVFLQDSHSNYMSNNNVYSNGAGASSLAPEKLDLVSFFNGHFTLDAGFAGSGFFIDPSYDNVLFNNTVTGNAANGILLEYSDRTTIDSNLVSGNDLTGIFFIDTHNSTVTGNDIINNGDASSAILSNAQISPFEKVLFFGFAASGFFMDPSLDNDVTDNTISGNVGVGLYLEYSDRTVIDGNTISNNGLDGLTLIDSDDNLISNNIIAGNGDVTSQLISDAQFDPFEAKLFAGFAASGFFMDPSHGNTATDNVFSNNHGSGVFILESTTSTISNNQIIGNGGDGVTLINSSYNVMDSNVVDSNGAVSAALFAESITADNYQVMAGFAASGFFMDPSPYNTISNNLVTNSRGSGVYLLESNHSLIEGNIIIGSEATGITFIDSSHNDVISNLLQDNGFVSSEAGLGLDFGFAASGFFMDPSHFNNIVGNNITGSAGDGFISEASSNTFFAENRVEDNAGYGVVFDLFSSTSSVVGNNFVNNANGETQGRDDGLGNGFDLNFWSDIPRVDKDYDGINDFPYEFDGEAGTIEEGLSVIPNGLNFYEPETDITPSSLELQKNGVPVKVRITFADGFRVLDLDTSYFLMNGTIVPESIESISITDFTLVFDRGEVVNLIQSTGFEGSGEVTLQVTGRMNDNLLDITATDTIVAKEKTNGNKNVVLVGGLTGTLTLTTRRSKKLDKILKKLLRK